MLLLVLSQRGFSILIYNVNLQLNKITVSKNIIKCQNTEKAYNTDS